MPPARRLLRRVARATFGVLGAVWMFFEEWLWDRLTAAMAWVARLPLLRGLERRIAALPPYGAMALFVVPWLLLLPAKLLSFWLLGTGRAFLGIAVFVLAKIVGTAVLARLFALTKPALLRVRWFARLHGWFTGLRDRLFAYVRSLRSWQLTAAWLRAVRAALRRWWRRLRHQPAD